MKTLRPVLVATFVALLVATAAQGQHTNVRAVVPFAFVAGDRAYPAGEYSLKSLSATGAVIRIDSEESGNNVIVSNTCGRALPAEKTKLVFHLRGGNYFLYQVWIEGNLSGREFPISHTEKMLAQNNEKPKVVIVAATIAR